MLCLAAMRLDVDVVDFDWFEVSGEIEPQNADGAFVFQRDFDCLPVSFGDLECGADLFIRLGSPLWQADRAVPGRCRPRAPLAPCVGSEDPHGAIARIREGTI